MEVPVVLDKTAPRVTGVPKFVSGNTRLDGAAETVPATPVPCRLITCGLVVELSLIVNVPVRAPAAEGVKAIGMVQDWPALTLEQFPMPGDGNAKSFPEIWAEFMNNVCVAEAELVSVTFMVWLCVFTVWLENTTGFGVAVTSENGISAVTTTVTGVCA